ncbi:MAG: L,D-transpeptidase family protein [Actinomycetota bacterium]|nr:L,D-transpeptidase family protein [Actinomycetota bacterium]
MADVPYLRPTPGRSSGRTHIDGRARGRGRYVLGAVLLVVVALAVAGAVLLGSASASLSTDSQAMAKVGLPLGGGTIQSVDAVTGPHSRRVALRVSGDQIWPRKLIPAGERLALDVVVKRPGWISWLSGDTQTLHMSLTAPAASLRSHYLTVSGHGPLRLRFRAPVEVLATGSAGQLHRHRLTAPTRVVTLPRSGAAGTIYVAAAPHTWESARPTAVSWFPAGGAATAVASPAPGSQIKPVTPITLTFSKPVSTALGSHPPPLSGAQGSWHQLSGHSIQFQPQGYGYGLGAHVHLALPNGVHLIGGQQGAGASGAAWKVPGGSTVRLQQMLSLLGYLPLKFRYAGPGVGLTPQAQLDAAIAAPAGHFSWRYGGTPAALRGFWSPGSFGTMTKGALMAFENEHGITADGVAGPVVWRSLIHAVVAGDRSHFGYTFVSVSVGAQRLSVWHNGRTVVGSTPVNTGIASAPTATGTYPVFEHLPVTTMSGTNPGGSHYSDPGIPWVSYFNGGDALHGFTRAQYGSPQSLGCVEMPFGVAGQVYPYTPIGTLVHVA